MRNQQPLVSVIMNCFNSEEYLCEAIESVLAQTYQNWEIIFWDNQSTDSSASIFQKYNDPRFRYFLAEQHTTLGEARELASGKVQGEWLAFLDCDDIWLPQKLALQLKTLDSEKTDPVFIYCRSKLLLRDEGISEWRVVGGAQGAYENKPLPGGEVFDKLLDDMFALFLSVLIRRESYIAIGGMDQGFRQAEDLDILLRLAQCGRVAVVQECCCYYRIHKGNSTKNQRELIYTETIQAMKKLGGSALVASAIRRTYVRYFLHVLLREREILLAFRLTNKFNQIDVAVVLSQKIARSFGGI